MTDVNFINLVKNEVAKYENSYLHNGYNPRPINEENVFIVWYCKTLQNWKALASTDLANGRYYEVTLNGDRHEVYFDAYQKVENKRIAIE